MTRTTVSSGYPYEDIYGYARAVRAGDLVFVSGTTARAPHLEADAGAQLAAAIATVADALAQAGASLAEVVRTVVYLVDMADEPLVAEAHRAAFGAVRPASTLVQVAGLTPAAARVEIEVTAAVVRGPAS